MDGAFSSSTHPRIKETIKLPLRFDIFLHSLNINLGVDMVHHFWNIGYKDGVKGS